METPREVSQDGRLLSQRIKRLVNRQVSVAGEEGTVEEEEEELEEWDDSHRGGRLEREEEGKGGVLGEEKCEREEGRPEGEG